MKIRNRILSFLITAILVVLSGSCVKDESLISNSLDGLNWSDKNFMVLNQLITDYGIGGKYFNKNKPPYVVLDWDQTCAHFDVEEALMRYQLTNLRFRVTKDQFRNDLLKDNINGVIKLSEAYQNVLLADINKDLVNDYNFLYDNFIGSNGPMSLEEIKATPQYSDFIAKIPFLYDGYCEATGIGADYGYPWLLYLFAGQTIDEVKALAKEAISFELGNKLSKQTWQSPAGFQTNAGVVTYSYKTGLRVFPEMQNMISTSKGNGIDVYIVSSSYKPVVEVFSGIGTYGYNVPPENVIAMELATTVDGKILPEYKAGWVKTQRQGKVDAINLVIKSGLGKNRDPLFSAGDSDGDYEMLTGFPNMKLSLIWNRVKGGDIGNLCKQAVDEMNSATPRFILQGRNENTGMVMPCSESILLGKTELQLLY
ncbi:MAG: haloacid dehalogenase-like hydrolase [Bacteroidota bacterium]